MKGPGLRIEIDVRRAWRCPTCGHNQRWPTDITAPRCFCVRDGVPMKLNEGQRPGRLHLRPELRSVVDRIQGGEEIPRLSSPLVSSDSDGGSRSRNRPPRPDRDERRQDEPPRELRPPETQLAVMKDPVAPADRGQAPQNSELADQSLSSAPSSIPPILNSAVPVPRPAMSPQPPSPADEDEFGAGLGADETPAPQ